MNRMHDHLEPPPAFLPREETESWAPAVALVADYSQGFKPGLHVDWEQLTTGKSWAQLTVIVDGETVDVQIDLAEGAGAAISTIANRYRQGAEHLETRSEELPKFPTALGISHKHDSSPSEKVNDLLHWQQFIDTVEALRSRVTDHRLDDFRAKLLTRVEMLYTRGFGMLRDQLRNQRDGEKTLRVLLESQNETLIDIALRLVAGEPQVADSLQDTLTEVYLDRSLRTDTRSRAYRRLHPAVQRLAATLSTESTPD